jgi:hypothetical protein
MLQLFLTLPTPLQVIIVGLVMLLAYNTLKAFESAFYKSL